MIEPSPGPESQPTFTGCSCGLRGLLVLDGLEFSLVLLFFSVPLLPVVDDAVQHGLDLRVEAGKFLENKVGSKRKGRQRSELLPKPDSQVDKTGSWVFNLVDKRADEVDEAALQLGKLWCLRPVHHGLVINNKQASIRSKESKPAAWNKRVDLERSPEGLSEGEGLRMESGQETNSQ